MDNRYGNELKSLRIMNNLSQQELAKKIGVTQQQISYYESGRNEPTIGVCERLADFYGITLDELIGRDSIKNDFNIDQRHNKGTINNNF